MQLRTAAALFALTIAPVSILAAPAPPAPILQLVNAVVHGANAGDASAFAGLFTDDAVVIDENAPFVWHGSGAGVAWWHVVAAVTHKAKLVNLKATGVRIGEFKQTAADAYMVQSMTVTAVANGKPFAEPGMMTYTFHNAGGKWLISGMVWTTRP